MKNLKRLLPVLFLILICILLQGCYLEFEYSPYITKVDHENLDIKNITRIKAIETERIAKGAGNSFKFGVLADTHDFYLETEDAVKIFNRIDDLDFVMIVGDITNQGLLREYNWFYDVIKKLDMPYIVLNGNHDGLSYGMDIFKEMFGNPDFTFSYLGVEFICFNNSNWECGDPDYGWLQEKAEDAKGKTAILLSHIPNHSDTNKRFSGDEIELFNNILYDNDIELCIHGHQHDKGYTTKGGIPRYIAGSPGKGYGYYMIVTYHGDTNSFEIEQCSL